MTFRFARFRILEGSQNVEEQHPLTIIQGCRFVPYTFGNYPPQMVPMDIKVGFQGLTLIQGQIYNPVIWMKLVTTCDKARLSLPNSAIAETLVAMDPFQPTWFEESSENLNLKRFLGQ